MKDIMGATDAIIAERTRAELPALTSLRFFAALFVALMHVEGCSDSAPLHWIVGLGYTGVTFFFILSGFILAHRYCNTDFRQPNASKNFYLARVARIYPVYAIALIIEIGMRIVYKSFVLPNALVRLLTEILVINAWIPNASAALFNAPVWTISDEAFFYYLFPRIATRLKSWKFTQNAIFLVIWCGCVDAVQMLWIYLNHGMNRSLTDEVTLLHAGTFTAGQFIKVFPPLHLFEFLLGIMLYNRWSTAAAPQARRYLITAAVGAGMLLAAQNMLPQLWYILGISSVLWAPLIMACANQNSGFLANRGMRLLGEASYSFYLIHFLVIRALERWLPDAFLGPWGFYRATILVLAIAVPLSISLCKYVERPSRRRLLKLFRS